ncbi:hypothetical protein C0J52_25003 [Blattella germanica]|nr:hypothetical protein C0J52_25003 [Blattella germanica]
MWDLDPVKRSVKRFTVSEREKKNAMTYTTTDKANPLQHSQCYFILKETPSEESQTNGMA